MEPFLGQIMMFGGNFAPRGWAFCDGQLLSIAENSALFSIFGTTYGGDGRTTFGLPDLRGRAPIHSGSGAGPGLPHATLGAKSGSNEVTLTEANIPPHSFSIAIPCNSETAGEDDPSDNVIAIADSEIYGSTAGANETMKPFNTATYGAGRAFNVQNPHQAVNFVVALVGIFPSRS